ncbi:hypothetical protein QYM36_003364 [Artemia franciscana]|uniref:Uncharacterized protein n=1 Tax=Artemia franciscana TaxID=6661 RepID=A0AA88I4K0_ARTSF|nr:hypothetical protein QYM36_003364 [Artemia franciscana]KAK2721053.1 hypothetical protein QYM36_003364 [Artemia franciscana]
MDLPQIPKMAELITLSESSDIKNGVQDALSGDSKELCDISHLNLGLKGEAVSASTFSEFSGSCKLEPDTQELGSTFFHNKEVEDASLNDAETVMEISNSTLLNGRQNLPVVVSPAIFNSLSELDSQELNSNNEERRDQKVNGDPSFDHFATILHRLAVFFFDKYIVYLIYNSKIILNMFVMRYFF